MKNLIKEIEPIASKLYNSWIVIEDFDRMVKEWWGEPSRDHMWSLAL